jgi:hypothetical protein
MRPSFVLLALAAGMAPAAAQPLRSGPERGGSCFLYEHRDMQGARMRLPNTDRVSFARSDIGSSAWRERPRWNDVVSSAQVDPGCTLQVWEHAEGGGESHVWRGGRNGLNVNYVGSRWNDRISAAACTCR